MVSPTLVVAATKIVPKLKAAVSLVVMEVCPERESCDDGFTDACGTCNETCTDVGTGATCGDGDLCPELEACDDGFTDACGTCNADCSGAGLGATCGDSDVCPELEQCDDGFADACGSCNADCSGVGSGATCGDGEQCPELEAVMTVLRTPVVLAMRTVLPLARVYLR